MGKYKLEFKIEYPSKSEKRNSTIDNVLSDSDICYSFDSDLVIPIPRDGSMIEIGGKEYWTTSKISYRLEENTYVSILTIKPYNGAASTTGYSGVDGTLYGGLLKG